MNWCGGAKNRIQPQESERKKMKKCKQEKLNLSRKSKNAVLSKDIGHLACVSNVHFKQKPVSQIRTKSKAFSSLGGPFKKKNKSEILGRSQAEYDCNRIQRVFLPPNHNNSFPESKLEFDDGVYDSVNTNQTNESQIQQESFIQQQQQQADSEPKRKEYHQSDSIPYIGQNQNTCPTSFYNQEEAGPSYQVMEEADITNHPSYSVKEEFSKCNSRDGGWYAEETLKDLGTLHASKRIQEDSPYNPRPAAAGPKMNMRPDDEDPYSRFDVFLQYSSPTELFRPSVEWDRKPSSDTYLDTVESEDKDQFVFESRSLFGQKRKVSLDKKYDNQQPAASIYSQQENIQEDQLYENNSSTDHLSFLKHQMIDQPTTDDDDFTSTTLDHSHHNNVIIQQQNNNDNQPHRYIIPTMTSSSLHADTTVVNRSSRGSARHNRSFAAESQGPRDSIERSSSSPSVSSMLGVSPEECPSCDAKQKLLMTMLGSYVKDGSSSSSKKKMNLSKLATYFQLISKLECCEHSSDLDCSLLGGTHRPQTSHASPSSSSHSIVTMVDAACSPIRWPSCNVGTSTEKIGSNAKQSSRAGQQRPPLYKQFTP